MALCQYSPLSGNNWNDLIYVDGHPPPGPKDFPLSSLVRVTAGYLNVIGTPILKGRSISEQDTATSRHVAVINEAFAQKFFKNQDPIGKYFGRSEIGASRLYEIVGVAKDARYLARNFGKPVVPFFFIPESQYDVFPTAANTQGDLRTHFLSDIVIETKPGAHLSSAQLRRAMASVDPNLPIISIHSLKEQVAAQFTQQRLLARLTSFFGVLSLLLSCIGLYGATAYNAGQRTNEIGIRMALGATRGHILALILRGAFGLILLGLLIGLPLTFVAGQVLDHQLYDLNPYAPVVISIAVTALGISALIASLIPALRASRISPLEALHTE